MQPGGSLLGLMLAPALLFPNVIVGIASAWVETNQVDRWSRDMRLLHQRLDPAHRIGGARVVVCEELKVRSFRQRLELAQQGHCRRRDLGRDWGRRHDDTALGQAIELELHAQEQRAVGAIVVGLVNDGRRYLVFRHGPKGGRVGSEDEKFGGHHKEQETAPSTRGKAVGQGEEDLASLVVQPNPQQQAVRLLIPREWLPEMGRLIKQGDDRQTGQDPLQGSASQLLFELSNVLAGGHDGCQ